MRPAKLVQIRERAGKLAPTVPDPRWQMLYQDHLDLVQEIERMRGALHLLLSNPEVTPGITWALTLILNGEWNE